LPPLRQDPNEARVDLVFRTVATRWREVIECARKHKDKVFGDYAREIQEFYSGPRDWSRLMLGHGFGDDDLPDPAFTISVNKAFEYVSIFGPALYYENPVRTVKARMPVDVPPDFLLAVGIDPNSYQAILQQEQARVMVDGLRSVLIGAYLNWTPHECGLAADSRQAIDEALVKGASCLWTEVDTPPGTDFKIVRSRFDSIDDLLIDPDATSLSDALWIAKRCVHPTWEVERIYGYAPGTIRPNAESNASQGHADADDDARHGRAKGESNDLLVYYKIWSKMGIGGRLPKTIPSHADALEIFGDYCYVVVAEGVSYPLNLPPDALDEQAESPDALFAMVEWPTPYWASGRWPVEVLSFCRIANSPWPMAPLRAGLAELKFLNWAHSFLCGHIRITSRDFIAVLKSLPEEIKTTLLSGKDLEMIEINSSENRPLSELVQFLQHPQMNLDIWRVIEAVENNFDKRVGLTELMYGVSGVQIRSAEEASIKQQNMSVRPEDMAKQVESWQAALAAKEAFTARYHLIGDDVRPVLGPIGAFAWDQYCSTKDAQAASRQLEYQIESGSTQKPNKNWEVRQMTEAFQTLGPVFQAYATQTGDMNPLNNLLSDFAKSRDLDPTRYQLQAVMPPPPPAQPGGGPDSVQQEPTGNPVPS
jgi:hypothetical protein